MDARDRETAPEMAARFNLRRKRPNEWRGACPCCGYATAFVVTSKGGNALFWCANGCARESLMAVVFGDAPSESVAPGPSPSGPDRSELVRKLWKTTKPARGSIVEMYLATRGLTLPPSDALRFDPSALHPNKSRLPSMRAIVRDTAGSIVALHSTFLRADGRGKADVDPARTTLGRTRGAAVRLFPVGERLILAEGIETALAAAELLKAPAWAALNAGNLADTVVPPREVWEIIVAVDNDLPGRRAANKAVSRLRRMGFAVKVALPDAPGDDFNDVLKHRRQVP